MARSTNSNGMSCTAGARRLRWTSVILLCIGAVSVKADRCSVDRSLTKIRVREGEPRDGSWIGEHDTYVRDATKRKDDLEIVFFGDSITEDMMQSGIIDKYYEPKYETAAYGIGGDRAYHLKWRVQKNFVEGLEPKVVSILVGINDIRSLANGEDLDDSEAEKEITSRIIDDIQQMASFIHEKSPCTKILLQAILPTAMLGIANEWPNIFTPSIQRVNEGLKKFAARHQIVYYTDTCNSIFLSGRSRKYIMEEKMGDLLHPSREGHADMAECMLKTIAEILSDSATTDDKVDSSEESVEEDESSAERVDSISLQEKDPLQKDPSSSDPATTGNQWVPSFVGYSNVSVAENCKGSPDTVLRNFPPILGAPGCKRMCDLLKDDCVAFVYKRRVKQHCEFYSACEAVPGPVRDIIAFKNEDISKAAVRRGYCSYSQCPAPDVPFNLDSYCHQSKANCENGCMGTFCYLEPGTASA